MRLLINLPAEAKICLMFIKYIDMLIPALEVEFKQVAFIIFQIILKTILIIKFYFVFKKMIIYVSEAKVFADTENRFKTFGFDRNSFTVPALSISLVDSSTNYEFLRALFLNCFWIPLL